jgi:mono/diheme cytochrome c family protein
VKTAASASQSAAGPAPAAAASGATASSAGLYKVVDGNKVDPGTLEGFRTWRAAACSRCHGANQEGLVGPSLINSLKTLTKQAFVTTVTHGRLEIGARRDGRSDQRRKAAGHHGRAHAASRQRDANEGEHVGPWSAPRGWSARGPPATSGPHENKRRGDGRRSSNGVRRCRRDPTSGTSAAAPQAGAE